MTGCGLAKPERRASCGADHARRLGPRDFDGQLRHRRYVRRVVPSMATASIFYKLLNEGFFRKFPMYRPTRFSPLRRPPQFNLEGHAAPVSRAVINDSILRPWMIATLTSF